jgi:polysaccharide export outer membrane protein
MPEKNFKAMTKMSTRLFSAVLAFVFLQATAFAQTGSIASTRATGTQSGCGAPTQTGPQAPGPGTNPAGKVIPSPGLPSGLSGDRIRELEQKAGICEEGKSDNAEKQPTNAAALKESPLQTYEPNAFQKFVADSTGLLLPMFGYTLFSQVPSTFAPVDRIPVPANYVVGPGDELVIRVWGQVVFDAKVIVDRNGNIYLPKIGNLSVAGIKYEQLEGFLRTAIGRIFRNFDLNANLGQLRSIQIFIVGNAQRPGSYTVGSLSTLVNALFASGGPSNTGTMRRIQLKRDDKVVTEFDLYGLLLNGDKSRDQTLLPGDVIFIPPVGALVAVSGSVNTPAIYELKKESSLADVVALTGGLSTVADGSMITIERIEDHSKRTVDQFPLNAEGKKRLLKDGDLVTVLFLSPKFDNAVTLRGHVTDPGRYPWRQGMRVRDLIPTRESLIPRAFWKRQNSSVDARNIDTSDEINWGYALIQRLNPTDLTVQLIPLDLGKCLDGDNSQNLLLEAGDTITIFSKEDIHPSIAQQERLVRLEGEVAGAGWYRVQPGETLRHLVARVGGLTPPAYLYGSEFFRESLRAEQQKRLDKMLAEMERASQHQSVLQASHISSTEDEFALKTTAENNRQLIDNFNKVKATGRIVLNLPPSADNVNDLPDIVLENGDHFYVPYRLASVNVLGEVYNSGSFLLEPGKSVGAYLRQAGGATRYGDKGRMFVLRADGSVLPKQSHNNLWTRSFESERLLPGDTIVVPPQLTKVGIARTLKDWTQIFTQFALGAAAINVLK